MDRVVGMVEAKSKLAELVGQVKYGGQRFILERRGRPMAVLISVEEYARLQNRSETQGESPLSPELRRRQESLITKALALEAKVGDPERGLATLFRGLPAPDDAFWAEIEETE